MKHFYNRLGKATLSRHFKAASGSVNSKQRIGVFPEQLNKKTPTHTTKKITKKKKIQKSPRNSFTQINEGCSMKVHLHRKKNFCHSNSNMEKMDFLDVSHSSKILTAKKKSLSAVAMDTMDQEVPALRAQL